MILIEKGEIYKYNIPTRINIDNIINETNVELLKYITKIFDIKFIFENDVYSEYVELSVIFKSKIINDIQQYKIKYNPNSYREYITKDIYFDEMLIHILQSFDNEILRRITHGIILHKELPYKYLQNKYLQNKLKEHAKYQ